MRISLMYRLTACALLATVAGACARAPIVSSATASAPERGPGPLVAVSAPMPAALADARQLAIVVTPTWNAVTGTLRRFARASATSAWQPVAPAVAVVIGRTGLAWGDPALARGTTDPIKHEGDGRSPAGAFALDTAFGFAARSDVPWIQLPYAALQSGSDCVDDEASAFYNTVVDRATVARVDWNSAEHMRQIAQYRLGVIVGYNAGRPTAGRGSCIFLHIWGGPASTTDGCTALDAGALESLMRWLDGSRRPALVQLPVAEYERLREAWALPPE